MKFFRTNLTRHPRRSLAAAHGIRADAHADMAKEMDACFLGASLNQASQDKSISAALSGNWHPENFCRLGRKLERKAVAKRLPRETKPGNVTWDLVDVVSRL